jgi:POT family proton-dependent oligopeptide transporter
MPKDPTSEFSSQPATAVSEPAPHGAPRVPQDTGFFGHPRGLGTLFFTEMWERFSYYGMRAILILFMTAAVAEGGLGLRTEKAAAIYGLYTAFVYLMALPGGWVADRVIGQRRAVLYGGIIIAMGHFSMAIPAVTGAFGELPPFYAGLALIVLGTGLLKPNISTMVGELYPATGEGASARRDAGFSIFYMGINIGAFIAPLIVGGVGEKVNWHLGFGIAGVGMVLGLIQYVLGGRNLGEAGLYPDTHDEEVLSRNRRNLFLGAGVVVAAVAAVLFLTDTTVETMAAWTTYIIVGLAAAYFLYVFAAGGLDAVEKKRVAVIAVLFLSAAIFWAGFEQAGSSLNLVAERLTDRTVGGWEAPASWLQSVNPLFIIALAPVFAWLWITLSRKHLEPSSPLKFGFGLILLGAGFAVMIGATALAATGVQISPMWLIVTYFLHTTGELALSPVGLSTVTKLAPHRMVSQMMGIWFMASALGNLIAGRIAGLIGAEEGAAEAAGAVSPEATMEVFIVVTAITVGAGVLLALLSPLIKRLMGGVK